ncbi:hypothetical protein M405DRAFT_856162 [Rhizopogon salebrosus TDB-379]|nr:hypothetical protein M405DRAFT_856162 [Rhizopogon salebrosus TDB-379]
MAPADPPSHKPHHNHKRQRFTEDFCIAEGATQAPQTSLMIRSPNPSESTLMPKRERICGTAPTLEDLLNPVEGDVIGRTGLEFLGDDDEIIAEAIQTASGDVEEDTEDV